MVPPIKACKGGGQIESRRNCQCESARSGKGEGRGHHDMPHFPNVFLVFFDERTLLNPINLVKFGNVGQFVSSKDIRKIIDGMIFKTSTFTQHAHINHSL